VFVAGAMPEHPGSELPQSRVEDLGVFGGMALLAVRPVLMLASGIYALAQASGCAWRHTARCAI